MSYLQDQKYQHSSRNRRGRGHTFMNTSDLVAPPPPILLIRDPRSVVRIATLCLSVNLSVHIFFRFFWTEAQPLNQQDSVQMNRSVQFYHYTICHTPIIQMFSNSKPNQNQTPLFYLNMCCLCYRKEYWILILQTAMMPR